MDRDCCYSQSFGHVGRICNWCDCCCTRRNCRSSQRTIALRRQSFCPNISRLYHVGVILHPGKSRPISLRCPLLFVDAFWVIQIEDSVESREVVSDRENSELSC